MDTQNVSDNPATRRAFLGGAATIAAFAMMPRGVLGADAAKPNSVFGGVRIGCITYSYRGEISSAEDTLKALIEDGLSEVELMDGPIRSYAGIAGGGRGGPGAAAARADSTNNARRNWPSAPSCARCTTMRASTSTSTRSPSASRTRRSNSTSRWPRRWAASASPWSVRSRWPGSSRHSPTSTRSGSPSTTTPTTIRPWIRPTRSWIYSPYIGFNFDVGHYFAGTKGLSPLPVLEKYHDRIVSLHMKDRTADGGNVPWGMGGTPLKEILQLMKKEKWTFPADIEVEYKIPKGSTAVAEVAKCVRYCKEALA